ncbi:MAG: (d)CMP kinase [Hyphomonadaceae bacterium]
MFLVINGDLGSGKTTVARLLSERLGIPYISTGELQRELAKSMNLTTLELNIRAEKDESIDQMIDGKVRDLPKMYPNAIVDSRMAWKFIPQALKVRLIAHPLTAAARILSAEGRTSESYRTVEEALENVQSRRASEQRRFIHTYGVDIEHLGHYDLIVQTDLCDAGRVANVIGAYLESGEQSGGRVHAFLNPRAVYPTAPIAAETFTTPSEQRIEVIRAANDFFVVDGHQRLAWALRQNDTFVRAVIVGQDSGEISEGVSAAQHARNAATPALLKTWEDKFGFQFAHKPAFSAG